MLKFKSRLLQPEQGFTLTEVLVATLVVSGFIAASMQAVVLATAFKVRAKQYAEATTFIQENLEFVKLRASQYGNPQRCNTDLDGDGTFESNEGYAQGLLADLGGSPFSVPKQIADRPHTLTGTAAVRNVAPFEVLQIAYSVAPNSARTTLTSAATATSTSLSVASASGLKAGDQLTLGMDTANNTIQRVSGNTVTLSAALGSAQPAGTAVDASVAMMYTEVVPDAAFNCQ